MVTHIKSGKTHTRASKRFLACLIACCSGEPYRWDIYDSREAVTPGTDPEWLPKTHRHTNFEFYTCNSIELTQWHHSPACLCLTDAGKCWRAPWEWQLVGFIQIISSKCNTLENTQVIVNPRRVLSGAVKSSQMVRPEVGARHKTHVTAVIRAKTGSMEGITTLS